MEHINLTILTNGIYLFSNTLSANYEYVKGTKVRCVKGVYVGPVGISNQLYFEDCPTNWVKKRRIMRPM